MPRGSLRGKDVSFALLLLTALTKDRYKGYVKKRSSGHGLGPEPTRTDRISMDIQEHRGPRKWGSKAEIAGMGLIRSGAAQGGGRSTRSRVSPP